MYMKLIDGKAYFKNLRDPFDLEEFPRLIQNHRICVKNTVNIEKQGSDLIATPINKNDFPIVKKFIKDVCKWGGSTGNRVWGNLLKEENNTEKEILTTFEEVRQILDQDDPDLVEALTIMKSLKGLGVSYASKHLRFMLPKECPVYDSVLNQYLPYRIPRRTPRSSVDFGEYANFAEDCKSIGSELCSRKISNPVRDSEEWFAADVESAIFWQVRNNNNE